MREIQESSLSLSLSLCPRTSHTHTLSLSMCKNFSFYVRELPSGKLFPSIKLFTTILVSILIVVVNSEERSSTTEARNADETYGTMDEANETAIKNGTAAKSETSSTKSSFLVPQKGDSRRYEFRKVFILAIVILITILVVSIVWFAYEMTQDCVKDEEEEQDRSLYLPLYSEEEEEGDIKLVDTIYGSNVETGSQVSNVSKVPNESKRRPKIGLI